MERRNPYLVLGVPFGASRDEATRAFARRTKFLRRLGQERPESRSQHTDLTGALHEIESTAPHQDPAAKMAPYRVPMDPRTALLTSDGLFGPGVFAPPPETLGEVPDHSDLRREAAFEYLRHVVQARGQRLGPPAP